MVSTRRLAAAAVCCLGVGGAWGGRAGGAARPSAFAAPAGGVDCWRRPLPARPFLSGHNSPAIGCGTPGTRPRLCVRAGAPRAGGLKAAGRPEGGGDDDIFGQDFPSYNNVNDVPASDGAPKFAERGSKAQGPGSVFEAGAFGGAARRAPPSLREEDLTEGLKERVYYVMLDAFDNYPPQEVSRMLDLLWAAGPDAGPTKTSLRQLVQLTSEVEGIAEASRASLVAKAAARYRAARNRAARPRAAREQRERERGGGHSECPLLFSFCANNAFIQDSRVQELNYYINYYNIRR